MDGHARNMILLVGGQGVYREPFIERKLQVKKIQPGKAGRYYKEARGLLVADYSGKYLLVKECLENVFPLMECYGLLPLIVVQNERDHAQISALIQRGHANSCARVIRHHEISKAAELLERHPIEPKLVSTKIEYPGKIRCGGSEVKILLKRSFYDCSKVRLQPLSGGKASQCVFRVHAWLARSDVGKIPQPFLLKIAARDSIDTEIQNYRNYAAPFVPFHLRPNLIKERCWRAANYASLVADYVDGAIMLRQALKEDRGGGILFALFEKTLKGFRAQPFAGTIPPVKDNLKVFAIQRARINEVSARVVTKAVELGMRTTVVGLGRLLSQCANRVIYTAGPYHGDLHTGNVMVRNGDAILIDYGTTANGPQTADIAALEVSLLFGDDKPREFTLWRPFIENIYHETGRDLGAPMFHMDKPEQYTWLTHAVRELRIILAGCQAHRDEAKVMLAAYMIRFARLLDVEEKNIVVIKKHAYALVVAERILRNLNKHQTSEVTTK